MSWSFLELALGRACPSFAGEWTPLRRTYAPDEPPSATECLGALRAHVVQLLEQERVAECTRLFLALERLLAEADPILHDLLQGEFLGRLAAEWRARGLDSQRVRPYLGPRTRPIWDTSWPSPPSAP